VVTAKTQYSLNNAQSYFAEHLAVGDYYQEGQKVAGEWFGLGAQSLGLNGKIRETDFLALCENQNPQSSDCLTQRTNSVRDQDGATTANRRIFYDFTFSPPKSVSLLTLVVGDQRIVGAHNRASQIALGEFESFAATRVRKSNSDGSRFTRNVIAGLFTHDTSRALDPHLHTHCIVFNATFDPAERRWQSLGTLAEGMEHKGANHVPPHLANHEKTSDPGSNLWTTNHLNVSRANHGRAECVLIFHRRSRLFCRVNILQPLFHCDESQTIFCLLLRDEFPIVGINYWRAVS
jgi:hypothetical protein